MWSYETSKSRITMLRVFGNHFISLTIESFLIEREQSHDL